MWNSSQHKLILVFQRMFESRPIIYSWYKSGISQYKQNTCVTISLILLLFYLFIWFVSQKVLDGLNFSRKILWFCYYYFWSKYLCNFNSKHSKLTILKRTSNARIRWFSLNGLVEWYDEKFIRLVFYESGYGASGRTATIQHRQHFVRIIVRIQLSCVNVKSFNVFAIDYL